MGTGGGGRCGGAVLAGKVGKGFCRRALITGKGRERSGASWQRAVGSTVVAFKAAPVAQRWQAEQWPGWVREREGARWPAEEDGGVDRRMAQGQRVVDLD